MEEPSRARVRRAPRRSRRLLVPVLTAAAAVATAASALAVDVSGTLRIADGFGGDSPRTSEEEARRSWYWNEWNGFIEPRDRSFLPARDLAVVLTGEGDLAPDQPGFRIANGGLWPTTLVARQNAQLQIHNTDPMAHELFAEGHPELQNATPTMPALSRTFTATQEGSWAVRDALYDHVRGHLHVIPDLIARATIEPDGGYRFTGVPPGTYTLKIYRGDAVVHTAEGVVIADRDSVTLEPIPLRAGAASGE